MKPEIAYVYNKLKQLRFDFKKTDFDDFRENYRYDPILKRYVRKDDNDLYISKNTFKPLEEELEYADKCHNLEEKLGCPLEVVEKALTQEIWYEGNKGYLYLMKGNGLKFLNGWCITNGQHYANTKDYKKTWWLKEDRSE